MPELGDFHFLRPEWLLGVAGALAVWFLVRRSASLERQWRGVIAPHLLGHLKVGAGGRARIRPLDTVVAALVLASIGLAGPTWEREATPFSEDTAPLVLALVPAALHVDNAVAVFDESFRTNLSERIEGESWSGIRRRYLIYPQLAGAYAVPPVEVEIVYASPNARPSEPLELAGPALRFEARVPPEAAGLDYFIAARAFSLEQEVEPLAEGLRVGNALTRTVTVSATDASSMMLPITEFRIIDGLAVYPDPTRASDSGGERGDPRQGTRVDQVTYVLETEGSFTLPAVERSWWDVSAGRLRQTSVPAVSFTVAPNPDLAGEIALPDEPEDAEGVPVADQPPPWWRRWETLPGLAVIILAAGLAWWRGPVWRVRLADADRRRRESEAACFDRVLAACRRSDARATMRTLLAWVDRIAPAGQSPTLGRLLALAGDEELSVAVHDLERKLYRDGDASGWRGEVLSRRLERVRGGRSDIRGAAEPPLPAPLNPTG